MPLRQFGRAISSIFRALLGMEASLLTIQQQGTTIIMTLDDLKAADAAEASAVASAVAFIRDLQAEHVADLSKLAAAAALAAASAVQDNSAEVADISTLVANLQGRASTLTSAIATLHETVTAPAPDTVQGAGADTVAGAGTAADSVSGGTDTDSVAAG